MKKIIITIITIAMLISPVELLSAAAPDACTDIQFVFARGSGAPQNSSQEYLSFRDSINAKIKQSKLTYKITDLEYPAVSVDNLEIIFTTLISAGKAGKFGASVSTGTTSLLNYYQKLYKVCPSTKWVLFGYSQGSKVIASALSQLDSERILYVAMFGDPHTYLPEGQGFNPPACRNQNLSAYRVYAPDCDTDNGILGARKPYSSQAYADKIGLWCNDHDLVCGSSKNLFVNSGHLKYNEKTGIPSAVDIAMKKIQHAFPTKTVIIPEVVAAPLDTVFIIDEMSLDIPRMNYFKEETINFALTFIRNGGRVALYTYKNRICNLGCSPTDFIFGMNSIIPMNLGARPQNLLSATNRVLDAASWRPNAKKSIVVFTPNGFVDPDYDGSTAERIIQRSIENDHTNINVVLPIPTLEPYYSKFTNPTGGKTYTLRTYYRLTSSLLSETMTTSQQAEPINENLSSIPPAAPLTAPAELTASSQSDNSIELKWQNAADSEYALLILDGAILGLLPKNITKITVTDLDNSKPHEFIMTSVDANYNIGSSTTLPISSRANPTPTIPASTPTQTPTIGVPSAGAK